MDALSLSEAVGGKLEPNGMNMALESKLKLDGLFWAKTASSFFEEIGAQKLIWENSGQAILC